MSPDMKIEVGQTASYERTFTLKDVELFAELSGDKGSHHIRPDDKGRIMVHGLLTATLPTKLGGDINYIARDITFKFLAPVFVGDAIRSECVITKVEPAEGYLKVAVDFVCYNQQEKEVLQGTTQGVIRSFDF